MGSPVEDLSYGAERLLTGRVPNLQFYNLVLNFDEEASEFDAYCDIVLLFELIFDESFEHARLAHTRVPNDNDLEQRVVRRNCLVRDYLTLVVLQMRQVVDGV